MNNTPWNPSKLNPTVHLDRPGWIPGYIQKDWDTNPYAYQTEEELMPAGGPHGQLLAYIMELVRHILAARGLMFLLDTFLLYRDGRGIKRRIAPDLLLMPYRFPAPSVYDLDVEPPPLLVVEVTSPDSHVKDLETNVGFYQNLGIPAYLVIDAITSDSQPRYPIELHLWRRDAGRLRRVSPDEDDGFSLPEIGLQVWVGGGQLRFSDLNTGQELLDAGEANQARAEAEARVKAMEKKLRDLGLLD